MNFNFIIKEQLMQNSLNPINEICQQKVLSTQNSRNSTFTVLQHQNNQFNNDSETNFRLFTFMNMKNEQPRTNIVNKGKQNRRKSVKKITNKSLKRDSSGLIDMIEQSRKKREDFYKLILDSDSLDCLQNNRKCKTPNNLKQKNSSINCSMNNINFKKPMTPRVNYTKQNCYSQFQTKSRPKLFHAKGTHSQLQIRCQNKEQLKRMSLKSDKNQKQVQIIKIDKNEQMALMKKKKDLQKKLLQINQTLLLGYQKKKSKVSKVKK